MWNKWTNQRWGWREPARFSQTALCCPFVSIKKPCDTHLRLSPFAEVELIEQFVRGWMGITLLSRKYWLFMLFHKASWSNNTNVKEELRLLCFKSWHSQYSQLIPHLSHQTSSMHLQVNLQTDKPTISAVSQGKPAWQTCPFEFQSLSTSATGFS